jgi:hypothetical protein
MTFDRDRIALLERQLELAHKEIARLQEMLIAAGVDPSPSEEWNPHLFMRVEDVPFPVRVHNVFQYQTNMYRRHPSVHWLDLGLIWQVAEQTPERLLKLKNFHKKSLADVIEVLAALGVELGTVFPPNFPRNRRE